MLEQLPVFLIWYLVFLFSTTFHEFGHALVAYWGGDSTAYEGGHVTLDPWPHIRRSPWGMLVVPIISHFIWGRMLGWASVPYNLAWAQRHPKRQALMSLAGPLSNLLLAAIAFGVMRWLLAIDVFQAPQQPTITQLVALPEEISARSPLGALAAALSILFYLNMMLGLFNLIPVLPLDGAGVLEGIFHRRLGPIYQKMREVPAFELLALFIAWEAFPVVVYPAMQWVAALLYL